MNFLYKSGIWKTLRFLMWVLGLISVPFSEKESLHNMLEFYMPKYLAVPIYFGSNFSISLWFVSQSIGF